MYSFTKVVQQKMTAKCLYILKILAQFSE